MNKYFVIACKSLYNPPWIVSFSLLDLNIMFRHQVLAFGVLHFCLQNQLICIFLAHLRPTHKGQHRNTITVSMKSSWKHTHTHTHNFAKIGICWKTESFLAIFESSLSAFGTRGSGIFIIQIFTYYLVYNELWLIFADLEKTNTHF